MGVHYDFRSTDDKIADLLAEDFEFNEIAALLRLPELHVRSRFQVIRAKCGWQAR